jgi:hypothetical protein
MNKNWILIFYNLPSKPMSARVRYWRRFQKEGALPLKESVYLLPYSDDRYELCQWLVKEISTANGQMNFIITDSVETISSTAIIDMFKAQSDNLYKPISEKLSSVQEGAKINKLIKEYEDIKKTDFFCSELGRQIKEKLDNLTSKNVITITVKQRNKKDFQNKLWITRKRPFIDRLASGWLIKNFIDTKATFDFIDEKDELPSDAISFDMNEAEFTHIGSLCTFEALIKSFGIQDETANKIAKIIHQLDIKDDIYDQPEAFGLLALLRGLRSGEQDDHKLFQKGIEMFDLLYKGGLGE